MTFGIRYPAFVVSAAFMSVSAAVGSAEALTAFRSMPPSVRTDETGRQSFVGAMPLIQDPASSGQIPAQLVADSHHYRDGSFTGPVTDAYYGEVQVRVNVRGGRVVSIDVPKYPSDRRTSRSINGRALPMLQSEVVSAQGPRVDLVSGATLTSRAYLRSLNAALGQAGT